MFVSVPANATSRKRRSRWLVAQAKDDDPTRSHAGTKPSLLSSALPFELIVRLARRAFHTAWLTAMHQLAPQSPRTGEYLRPRSTFFSSHFLTHHPHLTLSPPDFTLFYGTACPWCHRTLLARAFYGLAPSLPLIFCEPSAEGKWLLPPNPHFSAPDLKGVYRQLSPAYSGRATAPLLIHTASGTIVSNESSDIVRFLRTLSPSERRIDLYPDAHQSHIAADGDRIHHGLNNGVYRAGFATSQRAYDAACADVFDTLDHLERTLSTHRYVSGTPAPSESDIFLFPTLFRFDTVYHLLFRCSRKRLTEYPHLHAWMRDMLQTYADHVAPTCDLTGTMASYYRQLFPLNPSGIVPSADAGDLCRPHGRANLA
ncbi:hypothetical protein CDCA_CDCA04G1382 [Cyanidium caldarium]|uniref:GST N-terminal domain-containing protein n=1 Tax=Cyanidium caldarium TaxID=2771 RepID=A0AAV9ISX0_CYACA|nr:hypothetical protein CDCA_CDCA04G1382 [Cyanidium caldarium]